MLGYGIVEEKFVSNEPLWPRERDEGEVLWPYRLKIKIEKLFERPKPRPKGMLVAFGINVLSEDVLAEAIRE
ncbi:hypothetical protein [Infirmifilum sp. SLHALR2]|nr:MAG: hypothetical protein B7L53_08285 [Thermofilum sp. NZ13]